MKKYSAIAVIALGAVIAAGSSDSSAAATPTADVSTRVLTISVGNCENTYETTTVKIKNKKKFKIKKIVCKSKDTYIAKVSKKGKITAQSPGKTKIIVTVKYKNKSSENTKLKKKKLSVPVTVQSKFLLDIPQTGMQYDETGKAKPIYPLTLQNDKKGAYSNDTSYIDRFPVWVETDYDTDQDGKRDMIMAYVQVPKSATQGYYRAPVLFVANPYLVGGVRSGPDSYKLMTQLKKNSFSYDLLTNSPAQRVPQKEVSTSEVVSGCSVWVNDMEDRLYASESFSIYNYYLIRGYAYVTSPGLGGSKDCEGLECCGERVEAQAYAAIVEWLHGDRNGYADKEGTKLLRADWCNGHTAMTGLSYLGTMAYEVATLGVEGLDTVIPVGAIASWYDYIYMQGSIMNPAPNYLSWVGDFCAHRFYYSTDKEEKADPFFKTYKNWLFKRSYDEVNADGHYGEYWSRYEYSNEKPTVPALLVEGLNDYNVCSIQTLLMRRAFVNAGQECKVIYHQGYHDELSNTLDVSGGEMKVGDEYYDDLVNRWLAHYMAGIDNGIDQMKDFTVQSNVDGSWTSYDDGRKTEIMEIRPTGASAETTVEYDIRKILKNLDRPDITLTDAQLKDKTLHTVWEQEFDKDVTLSGQVAVHIRAKTPDLNLNYPTIYVDLLDTSDKEFNVYYEDSDLPMYGAYERFKEKTIDVGEGFHFYEFGFAQKPAKETSISMGSISMKTPNAGWEPESCTEPGEPVKNDTYYDYTIYLMPKDYTIKAGHKLKLCIMGYGGNFWNPSCIKFTDKYIDPIGNTVVKAEKYPFTIDNKASYAEIPVVS